MTDGDRQGFRLVARNWRCPTGELDLVVRREDLLVFCEVKSRSGTAFGGGYESVTHRKRRKVRALAQLFLRDSPVPFAQARFDVASVLVGRPGPARRLALLPGRRADPCRLRLPHPVEVHALPSTRHHRRSRPQHGDGDREAGGSRRDGHAGAKVVDDRIGKHERVRFGVAPAVLGMAGVFILGMFGG